MKKYQGVMLVTVYQTVYVEMDDNATEEEAKEAMRSKACEVVSEDADVDAIYQELYEFYGEVTND